MHPHSSSAKISRTFMPRELNILPIMNRADSDLSERVDSLVVTPPRDCYDTDDDASAYRSVAGQSILTIDDASLTGRRTDWLPPSFQDVYAPAGWLGLVISSKDFGPPTIQSVKVRG